MGKTKEKLTWELEREREWRVLCLIECICKSGKNEWVGNKYKYGPCQPFGSGKLLFSH